MSRSFSKRFALDGLDQDLGKATYSIEGAMTVGLKVLVKLRYGNGNFF